MKSLQRELIDAMRSMETQGINQGKAGNGSTREQEGFLITPSGVAYAELEETDIMNMTLDGQWSGKEGRRPSSEWRFHRDIYRERPDVNAILHTHGLGVSTLACANRSLPAFHYMVAIAGGTDIQCAEYATFGTQALSDNVSRALENRKACLLAHHGMIAVGNSLKEALTIAIEVEHLARVYWQVLQLGVPELLTTGPLPAVPEQFRSG